MSRPRKARNLKLIQGTLQKCRDTNKEPKSIKIKEIPEPPYKIKGEAKKEWERIMPFLLKNNLIGAEGLNYVLTYCALHAAIRKASTEDRILDIPASYLTQYHKMATAIGITPEARANMYPSGSKPADEKKKNAFEGLKDVGT